MQFSSVRLTSAVGASKQYNFFLDRRGNPSPYILKEITGLDAPELEMNTVELPGGGFDFSYRRSGLRQIVITIGFRPDYKNFVTVSDLRQELYFLLDTRAGRQMTVSLRDDPDAPDVVRAFGVVSKFEANPFSKSPEVIITIDCMKPYLEAQNKVSDTPDPSPNGSVTNPGSAETEFELRIPVIRNRSDIVVSRAVWGGSIGVDYDFRAKDIIFISTISGQRKIQCIRGTTTINLMPFIYASSDWITLFPGETLINFSGSPDTLGRPVFTFTPKYWGI